MEKFEDNIKGHRELRTIQEQDIKDNEDTLNGIKNELNILDEQYQKARDKESGIKSQIAQKEQDIAVFKEKITASGDNKERIDKELVELESAIGQNISNTNAANDKIVILKESKMEAGEKLRGLKEKSDEAGRLVRELRENANISNEGLINIQNKINSIKSEQGRLIRQKEIIENRVEETGNEVEKIRLNIDNIETEHQAYQQQMGEFDAKIKSAEDALNSGREKQKELQDKIDEIRDKTAEQKNILSRKSASLDFLKGLIDSGESTKFLINSEQWAPEADKILLAEAVGADDKFRVAIESALGETGKYFVVNNKKDALSAFSTLRNHMTKENPLLYAGKAFPSLTALQK